MKYSIATSPSHHNVTRAFHKEITGCRVGYALALPVEDEVSAALTIEVQYLFFGHDSKATCYDLVFIAGKALITAFTASVWYLVSLVEEAIHLLSALADAVVLVQRRGNNGEVYRRA
jgi:hypothetical protein